jgi:hypothetical protein
MTPSIFSAVRLSRRRFSDFPAGAPRRGHSVHSVAVEPHEVLEAAVQARLAEVAVVPVQPGEVAEVADDRSLAVSHRADADFRALADPRWAVVPGFGGD